MLNKARKDIKRNDTVEIMVGKDRGKTGVILKVLREQNRAVVEKVNIVKRLVFYIGRPEKIMVFNKNGLGRSNVSRRFESPDPLNFAGGKSVSKAPQYYAKNL